MLEIIGKVLRRWKQITLGGFIILKRVGNHRQCPPAMWQINTRSSGDGTNNTLAMEIILKFSGKASCGAEINTWGIWVLARVRFLRKTMVQYGFATYLEMGFDSLNLQLCELKEWENGGGLWRCRKGQPPDQPPSPLTQKSSCKSHFWKALPLCNSLIQPLEYTPISASRSPLPPTQKSYANLTLRHLLRRTCR